MIPLPVDFALPSDLLTGEGEAVSDSTDSGSRPERGANENVPAVPVFRQLRLFAAENPMRTRFPRAFMQTVPREPGVYYFRDAAGKLLYVGQSHELRKRVGSYRHVHPDRHPRRLVRLVHQVRQIEWEICESPEAAIERERVLLLELRPGFNRAGVWKPPPWWLRVGVEERIGDLGNHVMSLRIELWADAVVRVGGASGHSGVGDGDLARTVPGISQAGESAGWGTLLGPFPSSFRWVHAALLRCLHRWLFPEIPLHSLPVGLMGEKALREISWSLPATMPAEQVAGQICECFRASSGDRGGTGSPLLSDFNALVHDDLPPVEKEFWQSQVEAVVKFVEKIGGGAGRVGAQ